jgi:hypothetical protein
MPNLRGYGESEMSNPSCKTYASGFDANSTTFDGTGWVPDKVLNGSMNLTE